MQMSLQRMWHFTIGSQILQMAKGHLSFSVMVEELRIQPAVHSCAFSKDLLVLQKIMSFQEL
uniref:Uncharacterized protein n=1 Tax=Arundo donax TaxID=35708 RepID=A0A0A9DRD7_ARUDO